MKNNNVAFFFFYTPESQETAQVLAHVTSTLSILYVLDLVFGINPIKKFTAGFLPIKLGASATSTAA